MGKILLAVQSGEIQRQLETYCAKKKREDTFELATSVIQVRQLLADNEYTGMIMQYQLGAVPFTAEEIVSFHNTNESMSMVIIVPDDIKGGLFLNSLLVEVIYGAIYASESRPSKLMGLLDEGRSRAEAKAYYGILDTVVSAKEANELPQYATAQNIANYKSYLETGEDRPLKERFEYIASKVSMQEVKDMVKTLEPDMIDELRKFPGLAAYLPPLPIKEDKKKKGGFLGGLFGGKKKEEEPKAEVREEPKSEPKKEEKENSIAFKIDTDEKPKAPKKAFEKPVKTDEKKDEPVKAPEPAADDDTDFTADLSDFFDINIPVSKPEPKKEAPRQEQKKPEPVTSAPVAKKEPVRTDNRPAAGPTEREKAEAERKRQLEEERIRREEKIRNEATKTLKEENERQKAEAERKAKEEREKHEAEKARLLKEQQEAEAKAKAEQERIAAEAEQEKARLESEYQKQIENEKRAREEAERNAKAEAEQRAKEDARRIAEAEKQAQLEKERAEAEKARLLKEQQAKEKKLLAEKEKREAELKAEAEKARAEAERKAREESARIEAEYRAKIEAERKAREEAEREAERKAKEAEKRIQIAESNVRTVVKRQMVSRRVVGIFGIYKGFDAIPTAVQLAKTLSQYEPVTYIEVPRSTHGVFTRYSLQKNIGPSFKSVPHMADKGEADFSTATVRNLYSDISFYVANDAYGEISPTPQNVAAMVNGTSDNIVLETGCTLEEARRLGIVNLCTKAVLVFDRDEEERYMARIREAAEVLEASGIEPYLMAVSEKGNEVSALSSDLLYSPVKREKVEGQVTFLDLKIPEQNKLLEYLGLEGAVKVKRKKQAVRIEIMGTKDIAVFGAERGNGVTHTCLMLADSVRRDYKVAMLELNPTKHMANLAKELNQEDGSGRMNLYGIDVYYGMTYQKFATNFRPQYQIVVIDFGTYSNAVSRPKGNLPGNRELFISCTKKYLVFDASPWRLAVLDQLVKILDTDSDPSGQIELLAPMTTPSGLKQYGLYNRVGGRDIHCMPDCEMPVRCDDKTAEFMRKLVLK